MAKKQQHKNSKTIQVLYTLMDKEGTYSKLAGTSICSLFLNTRQKVVVHIFHDGSVNEENLMRFEQLAAQNKQQIKFYNLHEIIPEVWQEAKEIFAKAMQSSRYTEAAMYRLVAPQVLSDNIERLIYLDSDTIVNMDIRELWEEPIGKNGMAAVRETTMLAHYNRKPLGDTQEPFYDRIEHIGIDDCFNSGVLLMDLSKLRPMGNILLSGLRILAEYPADNHFFDQNILNYYFAKDLTPLPWKYNILIHWDRNFLPAYEPKGIIHYMGKTLRMSPADVRDTLFYDYFLQTPWGDGKFFCRNHEVMNAVYQQLLGPKLRSMRRLASLLAVRCPVITATEECEQQAFRLFSDPDDFDTEPPAKKDENDVTETINKTEDEKKEAEEEEKHFELPKGAVFCSLGKEENIQINLPYDVDTHLYLIFSHKYKEIKLQLLSAGLKENEQFMNGAFLLVGKPWLSHIIEPNLFFEML